MAWRPTRKTKRGAVNITDDPASAVKCSPDAGAEEVEAALTGRGMKRKEEQDEQDEPAYGEASRLPTSIYAHLTCRLRMKLNGYGQMAPSNCVSMD